MTYTEASDLIKNNLIKHFGEPLTTGPIYDIHLNVITTPSMFLTVIKALKEGSKNNKTVLIDLGLFNADNLRVLMVHELPNGKYKTVDMYNYLLDTGQSLSA